ncbi:MAG: glycoside hydrolase family protein [Brevundimonas sp.]|uniref:lysozyme n=1 Tax=Brevundimonas sp. TaxID=1871086 RepID=UPI003918CAEE
MSQIDKPKLKVSRRGLELIKSFEGFRPRAERLADGRWVVGHGHTLSAREGATVDATEAELLLQYDLLPILNAIAERVTLPLNLHQVDALASFGQAVGLERFLESDVLTWVNAGEPEDAARALGACDAPALTPAPDPAARRRAAESALFRADPGREADLAALMSAPVPAPTEDPPAEVEVEPEVEASTAPAPADEAPVVTPTFSAQPDDAGAEPGPEAAPVMDPANENGEGAQVSAAATVMAMQRYSPYAVAPTTSLHTFGIETPAATRGSGPGEGVLVLTPPPEVEPEPPAREVWPEETRTDAPVETQPLFVDDPALRAGGQPVFMPESFEPERRGRLDWSETGAFAGMGAVGLTAFGAAVVGFTMAADRPGSSGLDQTTIAAGVLAVIGALCVGIAAYNLYLRRGGRGEG